MKRPIIVLFLNIVLIAAATVTVDVYEADSVTRFDHRNIMVGTELKLVVTSDANDFWTGGLFIDVDNSGMVLLSGQGKDVHSRDYSDSHWDFAGSQALVTRWIDSEIEGFDLFTDWDCMPGDWFVIDYTALAPGDPNVGFYEYSVSWDDPNSFIAFHQVPTADFNTDGIVNFPDYSLLASCWLEDDCTDPNGCQKADLDMDGNVDVNDLLLFADYWLWGAPEPKEPNQIDPLLPDPNLMYSIVDADGRDEITIDVGQTVTLYVDMKTFDVNELWTFNVEVDISDPNFGMIDNTAYDPTNPPGQGTARILASPGRWNFFDRWGPGYEQEEGIYLSGVSTGEAFEDGYLASFEFTCQKEGDVELNLYNWDSTSISGEKLRPTLKAILIHQNAPTVQLMMSSEMSSMSMMVPQEPSRSPMEMVEFLEEIWITNDGIQDLIDEEKWLEFIESVGQSDSEVLKK